MDGMSCSHRTTEGRDIALPPSGLLTRSMDMKQPEKRPKK
uniref:Uncharacterized protein n=1 Tax=Pseudomonas syringae pv. actinidiae TaxID=103796 RepID=M1IME3_PSESF|nr:hypothetical protein [Pseudomonas syringae pv. actinidiae]